MWLTCDCNFFIKLISLIILIFAIVVNGIGNLLGIGDIIETTVHPCYTTEESTTVIESETTTDFITEPSATVTTTRKHTTTAPAVPSTTGKPTTTQAPTTVSTTEESSVPESTIPTTQAPTTEQSTEPEKPVIPQPNIVVYDEQGGFLVYLPDDVDYEISISVEPEASPADTGDEKILAFLGLEAGKTYTITAHAVIDGVNAASEPIVITMRSPVVPEAPVVDSVTSDSISVTPNPDCEYQLFRNAYGIIYNWSDTTVFENLASDAEYIVKVRYKENGYHAAGSEITSLTVKTLPEPTTEATTVTSTAEANTTTKPATTTTKPSTTKKTTTTTEPVTTEAGPYISTAEEISLAIFGGSSGSNIGTVVRGMDSFSDGGYVACGTTASTNGDFNGLYDSSLNWKTPFSFVAKFTKSGAIEWIKLFGDSSASVSLYDIAVLSNGNIITVGTFDYPSTYTQTGGIDAVAITLSSKGAQISKNILEGSGDDFLYSVAATSDGYVVGGKTNSTDGAFEGIPGMSSIVINYDLGNTVLWKRYFNASKSSHIADIDVDADNNIFLACVTTATDGQFAAFEGLIGSYADTVILKYSYAGDYIWHYVLASSGTDEFDSISADGKGGCYVAGNYTLVSAVTPDGTLEGIHNCGGTDALIFRLDENGERLWYRILAGFYDDFVTDIVCTEGGIGVTGYTSSANREFATLGNQGGTDGFVCFYDVNGNGIEIMAQAGTADDAGLCIAYSESENELLVAGRTKSSDGSFTDNTFGNSSVGYIGRFKITVG